MASSEDTEITLGTGKLLFLFFGLVGVCALFFALGYSLGRKSEPSLAANVPATPQVSSNTSKASGTAPNQPQPMTFYKAVEQKDANAQLTPPPDAKTDTNAAAATNSTTTSMPAPTPATMTRPRYCRSRDISYKLRLSASRRTLRHWSML